MQGSCFTRFCRSEITPHIDLTLTFVLSWLLHPPRSLVDKGLSLLSYQLCNYSVTQNVQKVEAVRMSHVTYAPCGGWIPWRRCPKTIYKTRYLAVDVPESRNVTDCCQGYEQLGLYCVLRESRAVGGLWATPPLPSPWAF